MKLEVNSISFRYNNKPILNDITFNLKAGEFLAILGPNGSGKTTLLKCINGILQPQNGSILIDGKSMQEYGRNDIARIMGYVPQHNGRIFPNTVFDTLLLGRKPHIQWAPTSKDLRVVSQLLEMLNLEQFALRNITELSGGERQKVVIGRALAQQPNILLLDEPTSNLDLKHQLEVLKLIRNQTRDGLSAVMALHNLNLALKFCDRIVMLNDGEIFVQGGLEVLTPEAIEFVYNVKVNTIEYSGGIFVIPEEFNGTIDH
ncbi:ABC transporter ATP-binding protein [Candidatus Thorarchaeota archaeon]|nr:MAG: ABC transporter ATP-binding protein [Candidatus Thorarchaeota archaeon]